MVAPVPLAARVVEVIADLGDSAAERYRYGSGFIVRAGTVLTAAHVVSGAVSVLVRDPDKRKFTGSADPRFTGDAAGPGPDLALIEIDDPGLDLPPVGLARVDRDSPTGDPVKDCQVIGYPAFMEQDTPDGGQVRETAHASGHVPVLERLARGLLSVQVTHSPRLLPPQSAALGESPWSGMSGAPLLAAGLLLGVVSEHAPREGPSTITVTPLTALEAHPAHPGWGPGVTDPGAWWARLGVSGMGMLQRLPPRAGQAAVPLPVPYEVRRPHALNEVISALLADLPQRGPDARVVGLVGMGGSGKSVLAAAAARDLQVRDAFPDGQFWLELGPGPPLLQLQATLAAALGDRTPITDLPQGRAQLSRLLAERRCLLVLDNAWDGADLSALVVAGSTSRVLVTARDAAAVSDGTIITLDELVPEAALQVLAGWTAVPTERLPPEAALVAQECGYLPLAVALCGAMVATGDHGWPGVVDLLRHGDLGELRSRLVDYPHRSLAVALGASLASLPSDVRDRYMRLAVFNTEGLVPQAALQVLWRLGQQETAELVSYFAAKSLLRAEGDHISVHDLQMDYLARSVGTGLPALHGELLAAYRERCPDGWANGPDDGYFYQHLARHLAQAGQLAGLKALLLDLEWMTAKLSAGTITGLLADYDALPEDPSLRQVAGALRLSAHVLTGQPEQLPGQLTGRLASDTDPRVRDLLQRARHCPATPWLRPLTASLPGPGGPLLRTLTGRGGKAWSVAVSADGRRAVSGGEDGMAQVWNVDTGELKHTLVGHSGRVWAVGVSADGRRAVSGGEDGTARVWDLDTGERLRQLRITKTLRSWLGRRGSRVRAVAVSADGNRAVTGGSRDGTARVWDPSTGKLLGILTGHYGMVTAVTVSADGRRAVTGGWNDRTARVWDLATMELLRTLTCESGGVMTAAAVSADGSRAVTVGSRDGAVSVWDLDTGRLLCTLTGHEADVWSVTAVAVTPDGRRAVSGGRDGTVRVWDLAGGALLRILTGHGGTVSAVAVTPDGRRVVTSGSDDGTVRVWDLDVPAPPRPQAGHDRGVKVVAVSADGRRAVSGAYGGTVQVWNLDTGEPPRVLTGHKGYVNDAAVSADGRRAVTSGLWESARAWDLETGKQLLTLGGATDAVAVSADGRRVVTGGGRHETWQVCVWDLDTGALLRALTGHHGEVDAVAVSADGRLVIAGTLEGRILVWDLASGRRVTPAAQRLLHWFWAYGSHSAQRSHDGGTRTHVAIGSGPRGVSSDDRRAAMRAGIPRRVWVWDLETGARVRIIRWAGGTVEAVGVSADGRRAVAAGSDGKVRVWDLATGELEQSLAGHDGTVRAVTLSADGGRAVSGGDDGTVRVWDLEQGAELACFASQTPVTTLAATSSCWRVVAGTSAGSVHLLELSGLE